MVQKITGWLLVCLLLSQCSSKISSPCPEFIPVSFPIPDTTWFHTLKSDNRVKTFVSNRGFSQSISQTKNFITGTQGLRLEIPDRRPVDECNTYYADKLHMTFYGTLYPIGILITLNFDPVKRSAYMELAPNGGRGLFYLDELVTMDLYNVDHPYSSEMPYSKFSDTTGNASFFASFTNEAGFTFSDVFRVPFRVKLFNKAGVVYPDSVWVSKQNGIVQYSTHDGIRWSLKN